MEGAPEGLDPGCRQSPAWGRSRLPLPASHGVKEGLLVRDTLTWVSPDAPGFLQTQQCLPGSPHLSSLTWPPSSPCGSLAALRSTELSLGRPGAGGILGLSPQLVLVHSEGQEPLLPLGKSAVRMGVPVLAFWGAVRGRGSDYPWPLYLTSLSHLSSPEAQNLGNFGPVKYGYIYPWGPQEPHSEADSSLYRFQVSLGLDLGCWWGRMPSGAVTGWLHILQSFRNGGRRCRHVSGYGVGARGTQPVSAQPGFSRDAVLLAHPAVAG